MNIPPVDLKAQYRKIERPLIKKLREILKNQQLIMGKYVNRIEELISGYTKIPHAITCANGTDALILSLMALGIKDGDEVITTPYTFFATASSIALVGAKPVFVDIEPADMNINPALIERAITPRTKAIVVVHLFGKLCDMDAVNAVARKHNLAVVEDMAQSLGAFRNGVSSGAFGDIAAVSFYPTKNLGGIGEGGMVLTTRDDLGARARKLRVHGMGQATYHHEMIGINSRLDEIKACALVEKFPYLEEWNRKRRANGLWYNRKLARLPITFPRIDETSHIVHQYVIRVEKRDELRQYLQSKGIITGIYYPLPLHLQDCFAYLGYKAGDCPVAEEAARTSFALPVYPELTRAQKEYVVSSVKEFYGA